MCDLCLQAMCAKCVSLPTDLYFLAYNFICIACHLQTFKGPIKAPYYVSLFISFQTYLYIEVFFYRVCTTRHGELEVQSPPLLSCLFMTNLSSSRANSKCQRDLRSMPRPSSFSILSSRGLMLMGPLHASSRKPSPGITFVVSASFMRR